MKEEQEQKQNKQLTLKTFPVPFALIEQKENITITTNTVSKYSKEQVVNKAFKLHSQGNISEAAKYYQQFINEGLKDHRVFSNYGIILQSLGKSKNAATSLQKAVELKPDFAEAHYNLGTVLMSLRKLKEAEISLNKAVSLKPDYSEAHSNLGTILKDLGKLQKAEVSLRQAINLNPNLAEAHSNLGTILKDLGKLKEAELSTRKAIELKPDFADAHWNLSLLQLLKGDYKNGLENYEFRSKTNKTASIHANTNLRKINNEKLAQGDKLLVISEQGLGDTLQYMRYIPYLRKQGLDVSFCAQEKLHSLIKSSTIDLDPLTVKQANKVSEGSFISLLSLPRYLKVNPQNPIITEPYISSTKELNQKWKKILSNEKKPIIGINWQGNPEMEKDFYQGRSIPLEIFSRLFEHNEITILSLQKGFGSEQLEHCSFKHKFISCQPQINSIWDFLENAAIIENCDLIITCDTSIAHLAGGMGKEVWLLLKNIPFWTWGLEKESSFWYPSMKLFRQKEQQNWPEVMERVSNKLKKKINI